VCVQLRYLVVIYIPLLELLDLRDSDMLSSFTHLLYLIPIPIPLTPPVETCMRQGQWITSTDPHFRLPMARSTELRSTDSTHMDISHIDQRYCMILYESNITLRHAL
jgi:hypothetical protein